MSSLRSLLRLKSGHLLCQLKPLSGIDLCVLSTRRRFIPRNSELTLFHVQLCSVNNNSQTVKPYTQVRPINTESNKQQSLDSDQNLNNIWTIPNLLTGCRIVLTPVVGYMVLHGEFTVAAGVFFLAGFTDMIDGQIARRWPSQRSMFGTVLDPLADKFLISTLTISLTMVDLIPMWLTALIVCRDIGLICASFWVRYVSLDPPKTFRRFFDVTHATMEFKPTTISKANTVVQLGVVMGSLAAPILDLTNHPVLVASWYLTGVTTVISGLSYILWRKDTYTILNNCGKKRKQ